MLRVEINRKRSVYFCTDRKGGAILKKTVYRAILWLITLCIMVMMFGFSAQDQTQSGGLSAKISVPLTEWIASHRENMDAQSHYQLYQQVDWYVRKAAHFSEYALLGVLLTLLLDAYAIRWPWLSWLGCTVYAATDELHQLYSAGRSARWQDVVIDSCGALTGMTLILLVLFFWRKRKQNKQRKGA